MSYEIVATLGPSSDSEAMWKKMICAGVTAFRLNTSHMSLQELFRWLERLAPFLDSLHRKPPVVLDLQGSKWRLGDFTAFDLEEGRSIELVHAETAAGRDVLPVPHPDFFRSAPQAGGAVALNDAGVTLAVESVSPGSVRARVIRGGRISSRKGITYPSSTYRSESLQEKDLKILEQTRHLDFILYAVSYVKDAVEMEGYRRIMGDPAYIIAKLERRNAIDDASRIARSADELWLCRGDLGAEMGLAEMAAAVNRFSGTVRELPLPVLLAGQVLEHMTGSIAPTRSEVCCLHDALDRGYRGLVLSDETAVGRYPEESCRAAALFLSSSGKAEICG